MREALGKMKQRAEFAEGYLEGYKLTVANEKKRSEFLRGQASREVEGLEKSLGLRNQENKRLRERLTLTITLTLIGGTKRIRGSERDSKRMRDR